MFDPFAVITAGNLNNQAISLEQAGNYAAAERKYLDALALKIKGAGTDSIQAALTRNALGELYLVTRELDKAQPLLEHAERVRSEHRKDAHDASCTRDNLGRLWEMKGDLQKAREWRRKGSPDEMICSHFNCPKGVSGMFLKRDELSNCSRCKCVFYCGKACQKSDWKRHKEFCHEP